MTALLPPGTALGRQARVLHTPPPPVLPGERATITFRVEGDDPALAADVHVRAAGGEYDRLEATERGGVFRVELPAAYSTPPGFEYWISVRTESGDEVTAPEPNGADKPFLIAVIAKEALDRIVILSPEPDGLVDPSEAPILSVLFDPPLLPPAGATLFLDGAELKGRMELTPDYILYEITDPLHSGAHEALVVVTDEEGSTVEKRWSFHYGEISAPSVLNLSGRMETGWASVRTGGVVGEPYIPYDETSSLRFDLYGGGDWAGRALYFTASRDPIYDEEVRFTGRIGSDHFTLEGGDIYPSFSELTVSWLSGEGAFFSAGGGALRNEAFAVRTLPADTSGGFGTYSQFIAGERLRVDPGRWSASAQAAYGWEREESVAEDLRFLVPVRNLVTTVSAGATLGRGMRFDVEGGVSDTEGDDTTRAGGARIVLTVADRSDRRLLLEYHSYDPDFYALGSPTVDGGERGAVIDGSIRPVKQLRQSVKLEVYRDLQSSQEIDNDSYIVQLYGRTDMEGRAGGVSWNPYFLFRSYDIPYEIDRYTSRYGTAGLFARRGEHTFSLSATRSTTRSSSDTESWTGAAYATGSVREGRFSWKAGEQYSKTVTEGEIEVVAADSGAILDIMEGKLSDEERWTFSADLALKLFGVEWRSEYERIDEEDSVEKTRFTQHLLSLVMGVYF